MEPSYRNILVAVPPPSFERYRQHVDAIRKTAATLGMEKNVRLTFISVYSIVADLGDGEVNLIPPEMLRATAVEHENKLREDVKEYLRWFSQNGIPYEILIAHGDDPSEVILQASHDRKPDLLLLGAHHDDSLMGIFSPNIARKIAQKAPCDVLMVCVKRK